MEEKQLITKAQKGDKDAFAALVKAHEKRVFSIAFRLVRNHEDALDLSQEAFLNAWRGIGTFRSEASFATWISRLTSNICIDFIRKRVRRQEIETAMSLEMEEGSLDLPDTRYDPQEHLAKDELYHTLEEGLAMLPQGQRQALVLREWGGLSYDEIALAMQTDLGTVKSRISRARSSLRKLLTQEGNKSEPSPSR